MAARKRRDGEDFQEYRDDLKKDKRLHKHALRWRLFWNSHAYGQFRTAYLKEM